MVLLLSCTTAPAAFQSPDECRALSAGAQRDECWAAVAPELFSDDPVAAEAIVMEQVGDSKVRDFIWLTVTREVDPGSYRWCEKIEERALGARCRTLVSRPHLHRALQQEGGAAGQPKTGGPPPGGAGPRRGPPPGGGPPGEGPPGEGPPGEGPPGEGPPGEGQP
jgi:U5 snRNP spliceosome subunit